MVKMMVNADPFRRSKGPLAAPSQMLAETVASVVVDRSKGLTRMSEAKVVPPSFQVPVDLLNQLRNRLEAPLTIRHQAAFPVPYLRLSPTDPHGDIATPAFSGRRGSET